MRACDETRQWARCLKEHRADLLVYVQLEEGQRLVGHDRSLEETWLWCVFAVSMIWALRLRLAWHGEG